MQPCKEKKELDIAEENYLKEIEKSQLKKSVVFKNFRKSYIHNSTILSLFFLNSNNLAFV